MKTGELIDLLCAARLTVDPQRLARGTLACGAAATILVILLVFTTIGPRLGPCGGLAHAARADEARLRRLGRPHRPPALPRDPEARTVPGPQAAVGRTPLRGAGDARGPDARTGPGRGLGNLDSRANWLACLVFVPLYALAPLGLLILLARQGAPVEPRLTGVTAGLAAGGLAVIAYALHCPDDAIPFLSTWYPWRSPSPRPSARSCCRRWRAGEAPPAGPLLIRVDPGLR